jgi:hypothetical protein
MAAVSEPAACAACGRQLPVQQGRGRQRRYCDATCRSAARRSRERAGPAGRQFVNENLTSNRRHAKVDIVQSDGRVGRGPAGSGPAGSEPPDPMAARISDTARRLAGELGRPAPGSELTAVAAAQDLAAAADAALQLAVDRARAAGQSWRGIGDVLGTTRQAAFQRFGRPIDPRTGTPMSRVVVPGATDRAQAIVTSLAAGDWEAARRDFGEVMLESVDAGRLAGAWALTIGQVGRFERAGEPEAVPVPDGTIVDTPLYFEAGERNLHAVFGPDGMVTGLFLRPARP